MKQMELRGRSGLDSRLRLTIEFLWSIFDFPVRHRSGTFPVVADIKQLQSFVCVSVLHGFRILLRFRVGILVGKVCEYIVQVPRTTTEGV